MVRDYCGQDEADGLAQPRPRTLPSLPLIGGKIKLFYPQVRFGDSIVRERRSEAP